VVYAELNTDESKIQNVL